MRLVTVRTPGGEQRFGVIHNGETFIDLARFGQAVGAWIPDTMLGFIDLGAGAVREVAALITECGGGFPLGTAMPLANVRLLAPIPRPRKNVFGIGLNYKKHVEESARSLDTSEDLPKEPVIFSKPPTSVVGPGDAIRHNAALTQQLDWEVELAVIIGSTARGVSVEDAMDHVFGYSVLIDISARDCRRAGQWIVSKGQDTFCPMGPCIVTADEIELPHSLNLSLTVNGVTKQEGNTSQMIFKIADLISDISQAMTLEPGDIIATGTPDGVGAGRTPQEWLWPGDVLEATVDGIGTIRHPVVAV